MPSASQRVARMPVGTGTVRFGKKLRSLTIAV